MFRRSPGPGGDVVALTEPIPDRDAWQAGCELTARHVTNLIWAGGGRTSPSAILEVLRQLPRGAAEPPDATLYARCLRAAAADGCGLTDDERRALQQFVRRVAGMSPARRGLLEASVGGTILGSGLSR